MGASDPLLEQWTRHRKRLERETRVLIVDESPQVRQTFEQLLFRSHISARGVEFAEGVLELVNREDFSVVVVADEIPGSAQLIRRLRELYPDVGVVVSCATLRPELVFSSFPLGLVDLVERPESSSADLAQLRERLGRAISRGVDARMRSHVLKQLRSELKALKAQAEQRFSQVLDRRLARFKNWVGHFDGVVVVEGEDVELRYLSENLLVAGLHVECTDVLSDVAARLADGMVHLVVCKDVREDSDPSQLLRRLRGIDPVVEVVLTSEQPTLERALVALRGDAALYAPWPPQDRWALVAGVQRLLTARRHELLMANLAAALFCELQHLRQGECPAATLQHLAELMGIEWGALRMMTEVDPAANSGEAGIQYLGHVLDRVLEAQPASARSPASSSTMQAGPERRVHLRVAENQFARFRASTAATGTLAYLGDLSEGGAFIRTPCLLERGVKVEVELNLEYEGEGYLVCCQAEVAWVARPESQAEAARGFGVKFTDTPSDVMLLLQRIVRARTLSA